MTTCHHDDWFEAERLHRAASEGAIEEIDRLVAAGYQVDLFDDMGCTPLHYAATNGQYEAAKSLLGHGASVNANDDATIGETALALAVQTDHVCIVQLLIQARANPDINGWMGYTARIRASQRTDPIGKKIFSLLPAFRTTY